MCVCEKVTEAVFTNNHIMYQRDVGYTVCLDYKLHKGKRVATLLRLASYVEHSLRGCIYVTQKVFMD